jgi:hypothetical protein
MVELTPGCDDVTTNVPARTLGVACVAHALHDGYSSTRARSGQAPLPRYSMGF